MNYWLLQNQVLTEYQSASSPFLSALERYVFPDTPIAAAFPAHSGADRIHSAAFPARSGPNRQQLILSAVGAGGKTSLLFKLLQEAVFQKRNPLLTTTTHMFLPETLLTRQFQPDALVSGAPAEYPVRKNGWLKCTKQEPTLFRRQCAGKNPLLIEADGSRGLPVKIPGRDEPVLLPETNCILVIYGLSALGKPFSAVCHRHELMNQALPEKVVTAELMGRLMRDCYLLPLASRHPGAVLIPVWNQADSSTLLEQAKQAAFTCGWPCQLITAMLPNERSGFLLKGGISFEYL